MTRNMLLAALFAVSPLTAVAQDAGTSAPARPDLVAGTEAPPASDGIAECAAILAVASTTTNSRIERQNLQTSAGEWFAVSGDVAIGEGGLPAEDVWGEKVAKWAGEIRGSASLQARSDWTSYCAALGAEHGLSASVFASQG